MEHYTPAELNPFPPHSSAPAPASPSGRVGTVIVIRVPAPGRLRTYIKPLSSASRSPTFVSP